MSEDDDDGHMEDFDRFGRVTSSVAAAILGHDSRAPKWAWRVITGREPYRAPNYDMVRGLEHEADAVASLEIDLGVITEKGGFIAHPTLDWLGASPDATIREGTLRIPVEAKCPRKLHTHVPLKYFHQIQVQLECMGAPYGYFVSWVEDSDAQFVKQVERDQVWVDYFLPKLKAFHEKFVLPDMEPPNAVRGTKVNGDSTWDTVRAAVMAEAAREAAGAGKSTTTSCEASSGKTKRKGRTKTRDGKEAAQSTESSIGSVHGSTRTQTEASESTST